MSIPAEASFRRSPRHQIAAQTTTIVAVLWGALAFGAVYPWAFWPLAGMAQLAGVLGLLGLARGRGQLPGSQQPVVPLTLTLALVGLLLAWLLQLVPLPYAVLQWLNPNGVELLRQFDPLFAIAPGSHSLSLSPSASWRALSLFLSFCVLLVGTTVLTSAAGARRLVEGVMVCGVIVALVGIVQRPMYAGKLYGFWQPLQPGSAFGPFVNKNHFAGWMLMVLPLSVGYVFSAVPWEGGGRRLNWRSRLLWLASPRANRTILASAAVLLMGLALLLTFSRAGIVAFGVAMVFTVGALLRRRAGGSRTLMVSACLALALPVVLLTGRVGVDSVVGRFVEVDWREWNGRRGASLDALATFQRHWLTGTGINTYQFANIVYQRHDTASFQSTAHNDYAQLAAEGGLLIVIPAGICLTELVRVVRRRLREDRASPARYSLRVGAVASLVAIGLQETVDFSLQIPGNALLFAVVCGIALHADAWAPNPRRNGR